MSTLEQDLRRELAQAGDTGEPRASAAREEALRALTAGVRRARVRRVASIAGAGLSIACIGVVLVLALPRGAEEGAPSGNTVASKPFPSVSVLDRPGTNEDRLLDAGDAGDFVDLGTARRVAATPRNVFFAVAGRRAGTYCVLATRRSPSLLGTGPGTVIRTVASGCAGPGALEQLGIVATWQVWESRTHIGAIVPDGVTAVRIGTRTIPVRGNAFVVVWPGVVPSRITLVGPSAALVADSESGHGRLEDGTPTVTVPFTAGTDQSPAPDFSAGLRGHSIVSVVATPSGRRLTRAGNSIPAAYGMAWRVTVLNGGDFVESNVPVVAVLRYPGARPLVRRAEIAMSEPGKRMNIRLRGPSSDEALLGDRGTLEIRVAPAEGEQNTANNRVVYPVTITFG